MQQILYFILQVLEFSKNKLEFIRKRGSLFTFTSRKLPILLSGSVVGVPDFPASDAGSLGALDSLLNVCCRDVES